MPEKPSSIKLILLNLLVSILVSVTASIYVNSNLPGNLETVAANFFVKSSRPDLNGLSKQFSPLVVRVFTKKESTDRQAVLAYRDEDILAHGSFITSDGWILSTGVNRGAPQLIVADHNSQLFTVDRVLSDQASGFNLLKISVSDRSVAALAVEPEIGDQVYMQGASILMANIRDTRALRKIPDNHIFSTRVFPYLLEIDKPAALGAPVFSLNKELLALVVPEGTRTLAIPVSSISKRLNSVFQQISQTAPTLTYIDLSKTTVRLDWITRNRGAFIIESTKTGLQPGQIITQINGQELTLKNNLSEIMLNSLDPQQLQLTVLSKGLPDRIVKISP